MVNIKNILTLVVVLASQSLFAESLSSSEKFKKQYQTYQKLSGEEKWKESLPYAKEAYELGLELFGLEHKNTAALTYNYGLNLLELRKNEQAKKIFKKAVVSYEKVYGKDSAELIPLLMDLGHSAGIPYTRTKQKQYYKRALKISKKEYGEQSAKYGQLLVDAGVGLMHHAYSADAKRYLYQGHEILEHALGNDAAQTGYAAFNIGKYELSTYDYDDAKEYLLKALGSFERPDEPSNQFELSTHGFLVGAYEGLKERDMATKHCLAIGKMTPFTSTQDYLPLVKKAPMYPRSANQKGQEGYVTLEYDVDESGFVINPKVVDSAGPKSFEQASIKAAKEFRYAPSFKDGKPVLTEGVQNRFTFELVK